MSNNQPLFYLENVHSGQIHRITVGEAVIGRGWLQVSEIPCFYCIK